MHLEAVLAYINDSLLLLYPSLSKLKYGEVGVQVVYGVEISPRQADLLLKKTNCFGFPVLDFIAACTELFSNGDRFEILARYTFMIPCLSVAHRSTTFAHC